MYQIDTGGVTSVHPSTRSCVDCPHKRAGGLAAVIRNVLRGIAKRRGSRRHVLARRSLEGLPARMLRDIGIEPDSRQRMNLGFTRRRSEQRTTTLRPLADNLVPTSVGNSS